MAALEWDLFCRVIDNHGDVGFCWRLAVDLAARGQRVKLWIDDASALAWMAPDGASGRARDGAGSVSVLPWPQAPITGLHDPALLFSPGDVVIEAFGCELPSGFVAAMASMPNPPVWIDLEYLSAEAYAERSHGLPSPQTLGPGRGLFKHFYFPGFSTATGGLIRESGLAAARRAFDPAAWLRGFGVERRADERVVSLFCYEQPALDALLASLAEAPTLLLLTHGEATRQARAWHTGAGRLPQLRLLELPPLTQVEYDRLLWCCDLNFVRGEDSFVRAQWAGAPFVWQAYPQADGAHVVKVRAFLRRHLDGVEQLLSRQIEQLWASWNGAAPPGPMLLPLNEGWRRVCLEWRAGLIAQPDLGSRILQFVAEVTAA